MNLVEHAKRELFLAGFYDDDVPYGKGMIADSIVAAIEGFIKVGHSGGSAQIAIPILEKLLRFEVLSAITNDPNEWLKIDDNISGQKNLSQNTRGSMFFSHDDGKTYYHGNNPNEIMISVEKK